MNNKPVNIYSAIVFDLHPRVKDFIDQLNNDGQIDLDDDGYPFILKMDNNGGNKICHIVRNGAQENFILNTRKRKADPVHSWNPEDGFRRFFGKRVININVGGDEEGKRKERARRTSFESIDRIVDQILDD